MDSFLRLCSGASGKQQGSSFVKIWSPGSDLKLFKNAPTIAVAIAARSSLLRLPRSNGASTLIQMDPKPLSNPKVLKDGGSSKTKKGS